MSQREDDRRSCGDCRWLDTGRCPFKKWPRLCGSKTPSTDKNKIPFDFHLSILHKEV